MFVEIMGKVSLTALGCALAFHHFNPPEYLPDPEPLLAAYEKQLQRGVGERIVAFNALAKAEVLSNHQYASQQMGQVVEEGLVNRDFLTSLAGGPFSLIDFLNQSVSDGRADHGRAMAAWRTRTNQRADIEAGTAQVMAQDFYRYAYAARDELIKIVPAVAVLPMNQEGINMTMPLTTPIVQPPPFNPPADDPHAAGVQAYVDQLHIPEALSNPSEPITSGNFGDIMISDGDAAKMFLSIFGLGGLFQ